MTQSTKLMFLGFLVILAGAILLYSLATAIPAGADQTINPLVAVFYQAASCTTSATGVSCAGRTDSQEQLISIIRTEEALTFGLVLAGLILGIIGYSRLDSPVQRARSATPKQSSDPV